MGDHRATVKIQMEFHGIKDKLDMDVNYIGESGECWGVDTRIIEFCREIYRRGIEKSAREQNKYFAENRKKEIEKEEKAELERLKKKYANR